MDTARQSAVSTRMLFMQEEAAAAKQWLEDLAVEWKLEFRAVIFVTSP